MEEASKLHSENMKLKHGNARLINKLSKKDLNLRFVKRRIKACQKKLVEFFTSLKKEKRIDKIRHQKHWYFKT